MHPLLRISRGVSAVLLAASCGQALTPEHPSVATAILGKDLVTEYFPEGTAMNLCMVTNQQLGGTFVRMNGQLVFYLHGDPVQGRRFMFPPDQEFPWDEGMWVFDGSAQDPSDADEDHVTYDPDRWTPDCPTRPEDPQA